MQPKLIFTFLIFCIVEISFAQQKGYYRTPAIFQNTVIFTAEGDLWKYDLTTNAPASRLTTHQGLEINPAISADGKQVAFIGQYEGANDVYIMNTDGGIPRRITYDYGYDTEVEGWTKDGKVLYRTSKLSQLPAPQLAIVDPQTLHVEAIPLWEASQGCYNEKGVLFFTRFPNQGSKTKRYKGGFIEQIWRFDGKNEAENLTADFTGTSSHPMYYNNRIFFLSDRDGTMNIWSMDLDGKNMKQHSFSKGWDIQTPSIYGSKIVYQKGADIWLYNIEDNSEKKLDIRLLSDFDQKKPKWIKSPVNSISFSDISPNGNYAAIISRGRVFVSPSKSDRWVEVHAKSGIRCKAVKFVNNNSIAVLSDQSGEYEVWIMKADGSDFPRQITKNSKTVISYFEISPDGKYIAYNDKNQVLRIADVESGDVKFKYDSTYGGSYSITWSPDSRYLCFTAGLENLNSQIQVIDIKKMSVKSITTSRLDSYNPSWSADSNWLFFISDRNLKSKVHAPWGSRQPEPYYSETSNIYAMPLSKKVKFPFVRTDSWLADSAFNIPEKTDTITKVNKKKVKTTSYDYDWDFSMNALYQVPVKSFNSGVFAAADGWLYWIDRNDDNELNHKLMALKIGESKKYEPIEIATAVSNFTLSGNKKKLLVNMANHSFFIVDANGEKLKADEDKLELANWTFSIDPKEEWKEMYADAWRMMRDYFYDRNLHRVQWDTVRKRYEPLLDRITDRYELDDLISQVVGELSALHTFVVGGDKRESPDQIDIGFLGAKLNPVKNGIVIEHIYRTDKDFPDFTSPLDRPELKIKEGDVITSVNNIPVTSVANISQLLANKVNVPVKLTLLNSTGKKYENIVRPFSANDDYNIRYGEWELNRRKIVDSISNNDIGYIHLRAMGSGDMDQFVKQFYPVFNKKALIIDVRHNFGGNIDSWILEKLMRKAWMYWQGRSGGPVWNMPYAFRGDMVILCDQLTSSDGEAVTEGFRRLGLGKVIGMRTWGGEIWLSFDNFLVDNGIASAAEMGVFGPEGKWLIEGHGVDPDYIVDNLPFATYKGKDAQLDYALQYLQKAIKDKPIAPIKVPDYPDKSFDYTKQ